ncbi:cobalt-precorrin-5B (C(1))-methyltransferase CbiD [Anaeropeptidivorans aminofermentans]|uniref:cobalt-precorrin-5B (C(1))-methyltransferase CbiD n=1 Tax=Anaeropeptidivorans aminofermentans TaxID=2934315 RepID=UPI00202516D1|nr:cobalt-precorrin-5B (C(1))-methyltransferase CbiD [Anaeropeptidivorans aminofermentans]
MFEHYITKGRKKLRCGYTTGTCATIAAKASALMLLSQNTASKADIMTPKGLKVEAMLHDIILNEEKASCAVEKDSGDDIDATRGMLIYAEVSFRDDGKIIVDGGKGIGRVTRRGLQQNVGEAAINKVPMQMIEEAVLKVCKEYRYTGGLNVIISAPMGEEIAKKTFNANLGIEGGISILGTTGIVEPQSLQALVDTIEAEIKMISAEHKKDIIITPGNYGEDFLKSYPFAEKIPQIKCANFIGETIDFLLNYGFENVLLVGHIGKFVKLSANMLNTHSMYGDGRAEIITAHAGVSGADKEILIRLMNSVTTDEAIEILDEVHLRDRVMASLMEKIEHNIKRKAEGLNTEIMIYSNQWGILAKSSGLDRLMAYFREIAP